MCRLLGYLGSPILLEDVLSKPDHSLIVQSYQPQEMTAGLLNADGFGVGWYHPDQETEPFTYKNTAPIWNDRNLPSLSRYVKSHCILANVRSATAGLAVDVSNCQPFQHSLILGVHNGFIQDFRQTLYRPIRDRLSDSVYQSIHGLTDSEHIFALLIDELQTSSTLTEALHQTLKILTELGETHQTSFSANIILSDGQQLVGSRYAHRGTVPTLYYLHPEASFSNLVSNSVLIASEPLFAGHWKSLPDRCLFTVHHDLTIDIKSL
ncbi:ergothioneine biosynthesis protein EgtC [Myxacorys almedinensis]|uniref:Ergothioneine biosynthesis protein EgtC n=1 Tax=Myxacorys almedinensis A TaxID=2690445 RepID=A0A8J7Z338_9CYAN|nr:ergothioneine biosynthesis protein EgtC [Myxacorys almedinensis]NDJ17326.1 ergothioneine biosynthesis protein EgtC [Myxacorys almedinensis A]